MAELNAVVAIYGTHVEAEASVKALQHAGIDMHPYPSLARTTTPTNTSWGTTITATA